MKEIKILRLLCIFITITFSNVLNAQNWHYYNPTSWFDVNSVEIPKLGVIAVGGGWETQDSVQIMFQTADFGLTWTENAHDGPAPWNKSIAFSDTVNGFGVGYDGRIIKSNDAGRNWGYPTVPIERDLNKIVYVDAGTYFVAGGTKSSDSMQTILKTTDNGNTWIVKRDTYGSWLNSISFIDTLKGFAVGDNGVIISTINGGNTWQSLVAPLQRDYTGIKFINSNVGYIVGGIATGLSRKTILRTINGGANWSTLLDTTGGILNDISFADSLIGYTVGNSATVLKTTNGGLSWQPILIDVNLVGNETFNAVKFLDKNFGAIGGKNGVLYVFHNPYPIVQTLPASEIAMNAVKLNGSVSGGGMNTSVQFEYGLTTSYGNQINALPYTTSSIDSISVYSMLSDLLPNTLYHFRVKAESNLTTNFGNDIQFYTGYPEIPNYNFDIWDTTIVDFPDGWSKAKGEISKYSMACDGDFAVKISNSANGVNGFLSIGFMGDKILGGIPFNERPDSLIGCFNYNIAPNDTALIGLVFKKNGNVIAFNIYEIYGNSSNSFANLKFPIGYQTADIPDTLIMAVSCSDMRNNGYNPSSFLIIDNFRFTGTTLNIPNHSFEEWHSEQRMDLVNWNYKGFGLFPPDTIGTTSVSRISIAPLNKFAVRLKGYHFPDIVADGRLISGNNRTDKIPIHSIYHSFTGYYKYFPENNDTLCVSIKMYKNNIQIGSGMLLKNNTINSWTPFVINIDYSSPTTIPDSASIVFQPYYKNPFGNSVIFVDNLNFDGFLSGVKESPITEAPNDFKFNIYPNPFSENTTVLFTLNNDENVMIRLFDLSGKQVSLLANRRYNSGNHTLDFSSEGLNKGFYICVITTKNNNYSKKIVIQ